MLNNRYLIEFKQSDEAIGLAGFEVCLALTALDLPLDIIVHNNCAPLIIKLESLKDFGVANVYLQSALTHEQYQKLHQDAKFFLEF